jgi:hypothetical protein
MYFTILAENSLTLTLVAKFGDLPFIMKCVDRKGKKYGILSEDVMSKLEMNYCKIHISNF